MATFIEGITDIFPEPKFFTPDFSFIDTMLKRKEGMYEEGFSKLNNKYNLINRDVTNPANAAIRDEFLKKAKMNLKDLSALDLSDSSNLVAAEDVFKPFYSNKNVTSDQSITQFWNQQESVGNSYRLKEGGKEFSQDNIDYINQQRKAFAADDPSSVDFYIGSKRYYTPYYDYNKEYKEVMKDFKPSHTKLDKMDGMYIKTIDDKSWNKLEIAQYLNAVLSDKAKQQLRIEGAVRIGGNPASIANAYMQSEGAELPKLNTLITKIDGELAIEKDPEKIKNLKKYKEYYEDQRLEIGNNIKMIKSGDSEFLKKNGESIAFKAYYNALTEKISNGYSHTDIEQTIKGNDVAMMYFRNDQDWQRTYYQDKQAWQRTLYSEKKADDREKAKNWSEAEPYEMAGTNLAVYNKQLNDDFKKAGDERQVAYSNLVSYIATKLNKSADEITENDFNTWVSNSSNQNSILYKAYHNAHEAYSVAEQSININKQSKTDYIKSQMGNNNYNTYNSILDIYKSVNPNNQPNLIIAAQNAAVVQLKMSGEEINNIVQSANAAAKTYYTQANTPMTKNITGYPLSQEENRYKSAQNYLESLFGVKDALGVKFFPNPDPSKFIVSFTVPGEDDNKAAAKAKDIMNTVNLGGQGRKATYNPDTKTIMITGYENFAKNLDPYYGIPPVHRQAIENLENWNAGVGTNQTLSFVRDSFFGFTNFLII